MNIFKIGQGAGDVLASIPYMKAMGGGYVLIVKNLSNVPEWHPMNHGGAEMILPFLKSQGLDGMVIKQTDLRYHEYNIDMDKRVSTGWDGSKGDILTWNSLFYGVYPDMTKAFFEIEDTEQEDFILITRTGRYQNPDIDYGFLGKIDIKKKFLGTGKEYNNFKLQYGMDIECHVVKDYLEAAKLIKSSRLFISNQTSHAILAEGLAVPRILEICPGFPSVISKTPNGRSVLKQEFFEKTVDEALTEKEEEEKMEEIVEVEEVSKMREESSNKMITYMGCTSKSMVRRKSLSDFHNKFFVGDGLDIGGGLDSLDNFRHIFSMMNPVKIWDLKDGDAQFMKSVVDNTFDFVYSSHCLEHLNDPYEGLKNWYRVTKPNGYLIITIPDEDLYEAGVFPSTFNGDHKHSFTIFKEKSWSKKSINVIDMIINSTPYAKIIKIELLQDSYNFNIEERVDQTRPHINPIGECGIEIILQKHQQSAE